jgi:multiple sugar transport system permease protein
VRNTLVRRIWKERSGYAFIAPLLAYMGMFIFLPVVFMIVLSFSRHEFLRPAKNMMVGLANYAEWFRDPAVWETFKHTLYFLAMYIPTHVLYGLILALLTNSVVNRRAATVYRSLLYLPVVLPLPIVAYAWKWMYDPTIGVFTHIIKDFLGLPFPFKGWLIDERLAMPSIAIMSIWQYSGWIMMLFLVGLNNIPDQLYEAARIDGSSAWKSFFRITLPLLKPTFFVVVIMRLAVLGITVQPLIMTEGGPGRATMTYGLHAYYLAFRWGNWRMGYARAWYVMLALFATVLGVLAWKFLREESVYG